MKLIPLSPAKALNKAFLKQSIRQEEMGRFKANLVRLFDKVNEKESEEHLKNLVIDFLKETGYRDHYEINTSDRADLVIHTGRGSSEPVGVLFEVKHPGNKNEMIAPDKLNAKAFHQLVHYYMQERFLRGNKEIRRLIICNIYEWYLFNAADFGRFFFENRAFVDSYRKWSEGILGTTGTDWVYKEIVAPFIDEIPAEIPCACFDLRLWDYRPDCRRCSSKESKDQSDRITSPRYAPALTGITFRWRRSSAR